MFQNQNVKDFRRSADQEDSEPSSNSSGVPCKSFVSKLNLALLSIPLTLRTSALPYPSKEITPQIRHPSASVSRGDGITFAHPMRRRGSGLDYIHNPSASFTSDELERRYFDLFREQHAPNFYGYLEAPFWTRLVLRECHHEPAIRHAIFALAALFKSSRFNINAPIVADEHLNFALVQYSKAVRSLRQDLAGEGARVRLALIASVLFACFESFYGSWKTAAQQIYGGLNFLRQSRAASNVKTSKRRITAQNLAAIEPEVSQALELLNSQLMSFLAVNPLYDYPFDDSEAQGKQDLHILQKLPDQFTTPDDALPSAASLAMSSLLHLRRCAKYTNGDPLRLSTAQEQDTLSMAVDRWSKAFRPILIEASQNLTSLKHLAALQLHILAVMAKIFISISIYTKEIIFDQFTRQFQYIVYISRRLLEKEQDVRRLCGLKTQFSMGTIISLYYIATRCRDYHVRRDAIAVLKEWPLRHLVWDSWQAAKVAEWIVSIEEEGCDSNGFIPEEWRVRMNSLNVEMHSGGRVSVQCTQGSRNHVLKVDLL